VKVVEIPIADIGNVAERLRSLADAIAEGDFGDAHNVAWVIDCGNGHQEVGYIGRAAGIAGADAHLLLAIGMRKLENGAMEPQ
jgi:hypothetical protein